MRHIALWVAWMIALVLGCGSPATIGAPDTPGFDEIEQEIFARSCAFASCHAEGGRAGGLVLSGPGAYDALVGREARGRPDAIRVVVGDADASYLMARLEGRAEAGFMPPGGMLVQDEIDRIAAWIDGGVPRTRGGAPHPTRQEELETAVDDLPEAPTPGPGQRAFAAPEAVLVPAGTERQFCFTLPVEQEEFFVRGLRAHQGAHGHHANLLKRQAGVVEPSIRDCTDADGMIGLLPVLVPSAGASAELPGGMAVRVPAGTQLVLQSHYVNTTARPLRVRDVVVVDTIPASEVRTEIGNLAVANFGFALAPQTGGQVVRATCPIADPISVTSLRAHMHTLGVSIRVARLTADGRREPIFEVDPWRPEFRDLLPGVSFEDNPLRFAAGDALEVECVFDNDSDATIAFPTEMCASFGYFFPVLAGAPPLICFATGAASP